MTVKTGKLADTLHTAIADAITDALRDSDDLPTHIYLALPSAVTREQVEQAAVDARAWVREYHHDYAILSCR